ncbi:haloacid dehalogenase type II [Haloechinothrix sp. YIM 98757]|uniref:Haloacid dehalogenase type II n=1 Tax=Haloechinothrix aidingensis TaxID=2752311 RepID=A0A838A7J8_9PSEU|nr:haloacid dehalogenase type II [Haloechinothrix aidingensis]MBA0125105.1 haloacid dehalogenase type II [Haloechinothrix aidingensis]
MAARPGRVVFDVVETLMALEPLRQRFSAVGLAPETLEHWFDRVLRDGMALSLAGDYEPFPRVAAAALRTLSGGQLAESDVDYVLAGFGELRAHPDADPAMRALADAGVPVACLTNGTEQTTTAFLARTGLDRYVDTVISVADAGSWKPPAQVYRYALDRLGTRPARTALVAVHAFDCHGAKRAGLTTGWAGRLEGHYPEIFTRADVEGEDLVAVARGLLALPE